MEYLPSYPNSPISFPNLGIEVNPDRMAFSYGADSGRGIYWYGILIALGFVLAVIYGLRRAKQFGLKDDNILDMLFVAVPASIVCARAYYCIFYWDLFRDDIMGVFRIWDGGIAIYGAVIGAVLSVIIFCKVKKVPLAPMLDIGSLGLLIGQMIGRWGNFMNREAFGAVTVSFLKMGLDVGGGEIVYFHPTFLYESLWNFVGFVALHFYSRKRKFDGEIFALYIAWYGLGRAWVEGLRTDSLMLFGTGIRVSQLIAALSFVLAVVYIAYVYFVKKPDGKNLCVNKEEPVPSEGTKGE